MPNLHSISQFQCSQVQRKHEMNRDPFIKSLTSFIQELRCLHLLPIDSQRHEANIQQFLSSISEKHTRLTTLHQSKTTLLEELFSKIKNNREKQYALHKTRFPCGDQRVKRRIREDLDQEIEIGVCLGKERDKVKEEIKEMEKMIKLFREKHEELEWLSGKLASKDIR